MTDLQKQIDLLEDRGNEAELLSLLACDPEARARNRRLADKLRELAQMVRREGRSIAA